MVMNYKAFSQELYDANDDAKELVIKWLGANNIKSWVNPDKYGIDLVSDEKKYEVEVKHNWRGSSFPFKDVHFPIRKLKFANKDSVFVMLNHERTHALIVDGKTFLEAPQVLKDTIYTKDEKFVEIQVENCTIVKIMDNGNE